jgi:glycerol-1-phosphate dehydrogenase [NAD(P)+]
MSQDQLARLLAGKMPDPDGSGLLSVAVRAVEIAPSLAGREAALLSSLGLGRDLAIVSDETTRGVLGARVAAALAHGAHGAHGARIAEVVLPPGPAADMATVARIRQSTQNASALVAVGSGTINDLCKYAAFLDAKPYAVFGTAPSMNGYTSISAAITEHGHKKSLPAQVPLGVFLDLEVLANAPLRMIRSGLGDSVCRATAQADWLLAHLLLGSTYRTAPFRLLEADEARLLAGAQALAAGDIAAMETLARTLVLSGLGMTICGGSYPASQGEHLISHYIDMLGDSAWPAAFHGEHIAVTTLTMARLQQAVMGGPAPVVFATDVDEEAVRRHFGPELGASCWAAFARKRLDRSAAAAMTARLAAAWQDIRQAMARVMRPVSEIEAALRVAGAPLDCSEIGVPRDFYRRAVVEAREIRDRYTFLDLAGDAGRLAPFAAGI